MSNHLDDERLSFDPDVRFAQLMAELVRCGCGPRDGIGDSRISGVAAEARNSVLADGSEPSDARSDERAGLQKRVSDSGARDTRAIGSARGTGSAHLSDACESVLDNIYELLDHSMPADLEQMVLGHTESCEECGAAMQAEIHVRQILRRSCCAEAPQELRVRITQLTAQFHAR